jgi:hypothetical protein
MRLLKLHTIISLILIVLFISCEEKVVTIESEISNNPPEIVEILLSPQPPVDLNVHDRVEIQTIAVDSDGDHLLYFWECSGVLEQPVGAPDNLTVMEVNSPGNFILRCFVTDGEKTTVDSVVIIVTDNGM